MRRGCSGLPVLIGAGQAAHAMAIINNLVLGLLAQCGIKNVPEAR